MSNDILDVLHDFRADVPEPDDGARERALARITAARADRQPLRRLQARGERRWLRPAGALGLAAVAAATAIVLVAPWQSGPGSLTAAQAAVILERVQQAAAPPQRRWVLHEVIDTVAVPFPGAGRYVHTRVEVWRQLSPPYRFRIVGRNPFVAPPVESGGTPGTNEIFAFDPRTKTLYQDTTAVPARLYAAHPGTDTTQSLRQAVARGQLKVVGKSRINGKAVYELRNTRLETTLYVDAKTYRLVRTVMPGFPPKQPGGVPVNPSCGSFSSGPKYPDSTTTSTVVTHEYLPPTAANLKLTNVKAQHPKAKVAPAKQEPTTFHDAIHPFQCVYPQ